MAIRELIRRGYWQAAGDDGVDGGGAGGTDDVDENENTGTDDAGSGNENESMATTMAEAIAENFSDKDEDDPDKKTSTEEATAGEEDAKKLESSLPESDAIVDDKDKALEKDDLYEEPEGLDKSSPKTQERFKKLVDQNKEKDTAIESLKSENQGIIGMIQDTGATADQFGSLLNLTSLMYHPDKADPKAAVETLYSAASKLAKANGIDLPGSDPLDGHDDLRAKVDKMDITLDDAKEIALSRNRQSTQEQQNTERTTQQEEQNKSAQRVSSGKTAVQEYLLDLQKNDIDFEAKADHLMEAVEGIAKSEPPEKWVEHLDRLYKAIGKVAKTNPKPKDDNNESLRSGRGGGGVKAPGSMGEAISQGLKTA